jgi:hypothetical protein
VRVEDSQSANPAIDITRKRRRMTKAKPGRVTPRLFSLN